MTQKAQEKAKLNKKDLELSVAVLIFILIQVAISGEWAQAKWLDDTLKAFSIGMQFVILISLVVRSSSSRNSLR